MGTLALEDKMMILVWLEPRNFYFNYGESRFYQACMELHPVPQSHVARDSP